MSSRTASFIIVIANLFNVLIVRSMIILSKFVKIFKNVKFMLFLNIIITIVCSKTVFQLIAVLTAILSMQLDSSNAESAKNS